MTCERKNLMKWIQHKSIQANMHRELAHQFGEEK